MELYKHKYQPGQGIEFPCDFGLAIGIIVCCAYRGISDMGLPNDFSAGFMGEAIYSVQWVSGHESGFGACLSGTQNAEQLDKKIVPRKLPCLLYY